MEENGWRELIGSNDEMNKDDILIQESIWEIFKTEKTYILKLKAAVDVYIAAISNLKNSGLFKE